MALLSILQRKLMTMLQGIKKEGVITYFQNYLFYRDNEILGWYIELIGNVVRLDGLKISVDCEYLTRRHKSILLQKRYEKPERTAVKQYLDRSLPVIELGGCIGVVACVTNKLLANPTDHVVVEPSPYFAQTLKTNRNLNKCQFQILNSGLGYKAKEMSFIHQGFNSQIIMESLDQQQLTVATLSLKEISEKYKFNKFNLICDIEGAEVDLIAHEIDFIANHVVVFIAELHSSTLGSDKVQEMVHALNSAGLELVSSERKENHINVFVNKTLAC